MKYLNQTGHPSGATAFYSVNKGQRTRDRRISIALAVALRDNARLYTPEQLSGE
ncbi:MULTISPECIES: hypothetical protein [unclassified Oceanobacter]|uniref:hypothetical protein n=1 Tax=unclassified Oceanobacter TaxID=2620260 RepID=UPI0027364155|nr:MULTISPECIES: hypothetical protein [unclassified Oceanobacter]MDP2506032.1 hypothetical protein [Oceanobacter sp. 3_MG-2023]MDP2547611.1 hypothetical protein [Oceanobacter sp. 4_MG-2023]